MAIQKICRYQTSDKEFFNTKREAARHECELETFAQLSAILKFTIQTGRVEAVLKEVLMEAPIVVDILKGYIKRLPKAAPQVVNKAA